jgi:hypothetical protein
MRPEKLPDSAEIQLSAKVPLRRGNRSMYCKRSVFIALAILACGSGASSAEAVWPASSASDVSTFVTLLRFRVYADHCSAKVPQLKPQFESVMESLSSRVQGISRDLLSSGAFGRMKDQPVPSEIVFALEDSFDDLKHNFERRDADSVCPKTLQSLVDMDDEALKSDLKEVLAAVQNMIRNVENESASPASSEKSVHRP